MMPYTYLHGFAARVASLGPEVAGEPLEDEWHETIIDHEGREHHRAHQLTTTGELLWDARSGAVHFFAAARPTD